MHKTTLYTLHKNMPYFLRISCHGHESCSNNRSFINMPSVILLREHFMFLSFSEFQGSESRLSQDQPDFSMCIFAVRAFKHTVYMEYIQSSFFVQFALPNNINSEFSQTLILPFTDNIFQFCSLYRTN